MSSLSVEASGRHLSLHTFQQVLMAQTYDRGCTHEPRAWPGTGSVAENHVRCSVSSTPGTAVLRGHTRAVGLGVSRERTCSQSFKYVDILFFQIGKPSARVAPRPFRATRVGVCTSVPVESPQTCTRGHGVLVERLCTQLGTWRHVKCPSNNSALGKTRVEEQDFPSCNQRAEAALLRGC